MRSRRRPATSSIRATVRALAAGTLLMAAVGSCELPKPHIPSIGGAPITTAVAAPGTAEPTAAFPPAGAEPGTAEPTAAFPPAGAEPAAAEPTTPFPPVVAEPTANVRARVVRT